jgi:hypothetical protein
MADGWSDQRQRTLINFLVYCPQGVVFVKSVDASGIVKDAEMLCNLFCEVIQWVGHEKYDSIFWSLCAAHFLNLLLKDISSMPHVAELSSKASRVTVFVYNHIIFYLG